MSERACNECSLCCRLAVVEELAKPANVWCKHVRPNGRGCGIYARRPLGCRRWRCGWLAMPERFGDVWFPLRSNMVLEFRESESGGEVQLAVHVEASARGRWREEPYRAELARIVSAGADGRWGCRFGTVVDVEGTELVVLTEDGGEVKARRAGGER